MPNIFQGLIKLIEKAVQPVEFDLLPFELPLGFVQSRLLLLLIMRDLLQ